MKHDTEVEERGARAGRPPAGDVAAEFQINVRMEPKYEERVDAMVKMAGYKGRGPWVRDLILKKLGEPALGASA